MNSERLQAAYAAFLNAMDEDRSELYFSEERAIRAAIRAYLTYSEDTADADD